VSELTLTVIRLGFLAVLWALVLTVAGVMRSDLFGPRVNQPAAAPRAKAAKAQKPPKGKRGTPRVLVVTEGSLAGTRITLGEQPLTIGRAPDSTLVLDDDYVSTRHARLSSRPAGWVVEDLGSTNGTYLGRAKVAGPTDVPLGTPIRVGKTSLELRK
jgi:pSer/pThr/pTyr-binding forkhead associated (FHA) protein